MTQANVTGSLLIFPIDRKAGKLDRKGVNSETNSRAFHFAQFVL